MSTPAGDHRGYYENICDTLNGNAPNQVPAIQALAAMSVLEAGIQAAASGRRTAISLTAEERVAYMGSQKAVFPGSPSTT